jgi:hypothetical protein
MRDVLPEFKLSAGKSHVETVGFSFKIVEPTRLADVIAFVLRYYSSPSFRRVGRRNPSRTSRSIQATIQGRLIRIGDFGLFLFSLHFSQWLDALDRSRPRLVSLGLPVRPSFVAHKANTRLPMGAQENRLHTLRTFAGENGGGAGENKSRQPTI